MNVSRRKLGRILTAAAVATQTAALAQAPPAPPKLTSDQDLEQAKAGVRANSLSVARVPLPMAVEPAFRFKA